MIKYYRCTMIQQAPLRLSNGDSDETDSDLMLDLQGFPFIPGSSLTGVLRSLLDQNDADYLFGRIDGNKKTESRIIVSDAVLPGNIEHKSIRISHRDGVGLNAYGTAKRGAKYDFQIAETSEPYTAVIEVQAEEGDRADTLTELLMKKAVSNGLSFGARTTRGYGKMAVRISCVRFGLDTGESLKDWLNYHPVDNDIPPTAEVKEIKPEIDQSGENDELRIAADITLKGSFSVRVSLTSSCPPAEKKEKSIPDTVPMKNIHDQPVIPGTSLAGVFRHHMLAMAREIGAGEEQVKEINRAFGVPSGKDEILKSRLQFEEINIAGGSEKIVKRVAVERFTAAPKNQGLFCSAVWYGGHGKMIITLKQFNPENDRLLTNLLLQSLRDMHHGFVNFGGEGGVGRGIAAIETLSVNGKDKTDFILSDSAVADMEGF